MSFYSYKNANGTACPGAINGNVINGLCQKICIQVNNVYDAAMTQEQLEAEIGKYNATQPFSRRVVQVWRREEKLPRTVVGKLKRAALTKQWQECFGNNG